MTIAAAAVAMGAASAQADPFADNVVSYTPGTGVDAAFNDPTAALGSPTRFTAPDSEFGGAVTPFNQPFGAGELVTVGEGGSLVVSFDEPVTDDAANPFGIDLLIFGNSFALIDFGSGLATGTTSEGGVIEVSVDGVNFVTVSGLDADGPFPTLGFQDVTDPFPSTPGLVPTDFKIPVDPSLELAGLTTAQIAAAYKGSGGGVGIDLASVGLNAIQFVRISSPTGSGITPEIDGFASVPEPGLAVGLIAGGLAMASRRLRSAV